MGKEKCPVVDTFWQTETGGIVISPLANISPVKPGSASFPFFGIEPVLIDPETRIEFDEVNMPGVLAFKNPWPGLARYEHVKLL